MAETVGQHSVAAFTSPVNGTTPIDANTVRGNDNTVRSAYVDHDADPGIHVQSSSLASRPVAGTVGRKWITVSSGRYQLWYDDGSRWHEVASDAVNVDCLADANLTKGDVVKITGFNNGQNLPTVNKVTASTDTAFGVVENTVTSGNLVQIVNTGLIEDVDTNGYAVGTILYPNSSGGWTSTKPTSGSYQPAGYVLRGNVNNGVLYVEFSAPRIVERSDNTASTIVLRDSNGDFSAGTITATAVNATTLDLTNLEVTNIKAKDGTQAIAIADSTGATTFSANVTATLATAAQPNVTSVGTLTSLTVSGNTILGAEVFRSADNSFMRIAGGNPSATGAALVLFGSTHATAPGRIDLNAVGTGTFNISTGGAARASIDASGNLAVDTNTLYVDATNNRVGVGTTSPSYRVHSLHAGGGADLFFADATGQSFGGYRIRAGAGNQEWAFRGGSSSMSLTDATASADRLTIDTSGNLAVDTNTLYVDAANNAVGIGTSNPNAYGALAVFSSGVGLHNNSTSGAAGINFYENGSGRFSLRTLNGSAGLSFYDTFNTAERMRLDASGNLGLGVTPSAWRTSDKALQIGNVMSLTTDTNLTADVGYNYYWNAANQQIYLTSANASQYRQYQGYHAWYTAPSGTAGNAITFTQAMTLDASGNLGIGVTPTEAFCVKRGASTAAYGEFAGNNNTPGSTSALYGQDAGGNAYAWNRANLPLLFGTNNTERARITSDGIFQFPDTNALKIRFNGSATNFYGISKLAGGGTLGDGEYKFTAGDTAAGSFTFSSDNTERARITSGGYFKASNTGTYLNATGAYHELKSNDTSYVARIDNSHPSSPDGAIISFSGASPDNNTEYFLLCTDTTADRCYIYSDGDLANHDGVYGTISDERLKQDIVDASSQWDDLKAVRFRKYRMKTDVEANPDAPFMLGVVAQELEQTSPGLVDEHPEYEEQEVTDEDGNVTTERVQVGTTKTVKSSILLMKAAVALQEAMARIEALEARLEALEA